MDDQGGRTYFCNCYGEAKLAAGPDRVPSQASYHQSIWGEPAARNGRFIRPAQVINHTDEELEFLARLVDQRTAWQVAGRKGFRDGKGHMEDWPGQLHPAMAMAMPPR